MVYSTTTVGSVANYSCVEELQLVGDDTLTCGANGLWNGDINHISDIEKDQTTEAPRKIEVSREVSGIL